MNILSKENIFINNHLTDKNAVIEFISSKAAALGISNDRQELLDSFMERETLGSTGMGEGIAIPHAKSSSVNNVTVIIVKSKVPIKWESLDDEPIYLAIALMVPKENPDNVHLKVLSGISRKLVNNEFKTNLFHSDTPEEIMELFKEFALE